MAGDAQPLELSRSVCMLHMDGEPELASLLLPACSSPASVMLSRRMSVAIDCSCMRRFTCTSVSPYTMYGRQTGPPSMHAASRPGLAEMTYDDLRPHVNISHPEAG